MLPTNNVIDKSVRVAFLVDRMGLAAVLQYAALFM